MVIAVAETATARGKAASGQRRAVRRAARSGPRAALVLAAAASALPLRVGAQIAGAGSHAPAVTQTANGLAQVEINRPSGSGVSLNTYRQFDVPQAGAILNNAATMVQTQQAGWINGNPNFGPNDAARIIVNQVISPNPSQLRGALEIAGSRAALVLANPSGLYLDGAGFINTSRATLSTGVPHYSANGSLAGHDVQRGLVTVAGAGLNAANLDQVDLIARAVRVNAALHAQRLNVIAGANRVEHDTLRASAQDGVGAAPGMAIDVSRLGGMYGQRIFLAANEFGVGVANAGTIAAQAGDLTLQANGRLVLAGNTTASGNLSLQAAGGVHNSGTTYARQSASVKTAADLTNTGTLAARQDVKIETGSLDSSGTLGAGVSNDGSVGHHGALHVATSGRLAASGQSVSGGNVSLSGASVDLAGSTTAANGHLQLRATAGDVNLANATTSAQAGVSAHASGTVINDHGSLSSGGGMTLTGHRLSNQGGRVSSQGPLTVTTSARLNNAAGIIATQAQAVIEAGRWNNTGGTLTARRGILARITGQVSNARGQITSDGAVTFDAASIDNTQGAQLSGDTLRVKANTLDNRGGRIGNVANASAEANGDVSVTTTGAITNTHGQISSTRDLSVTAAALHGGGAYRAARDAHITLRGDYTAASGTQIAAGRDLVLTLPGTFTNHADLQSANQLRVAAGHLVNTGALNAGGLLHTQSTNLTNTGTLVGASASLRAASKISNLGPTALIGASDSNGTLELLAREIENRDDTTATGGMAHTAIFGMGRVVLAGGQDARGRYANAALIRNVSALIQSGADLALHADRLTNTRRTMKTSTARIDPASLAQFGIPISGRTGQVGVKNPHDIGGVYTEPPHGGQWNSTYQFTSFYADGATATTVTDLSPAGQIVSGGHLDASPVGTLQNYWSHIAAVGDIKMPGHYDADGWRASGQVAPGVTVSYSGQYHYNNYDNTEHNWQLPFGNAPFVTSRPGGYTQTAPASIKDYTLPGYASSLRANGTLSGTGISIDNTAANAALPSLGLLPGQAVPGLTPPGDATSSALIAVAQGGLFRPSTAPQARYLIETNPAFTSRQRFISSDGFFKRLGVDLTHIPKRLGDGFHEQQLVRHQLTALTGKAVLGPYTDLQATYQALLAAGAALSQSLDLPIGASLSAAQVARLTSDVVLMETRVVDGQSVLVPVVYLAKASQRRGDGPLISAANIDLRETRSLASRGTIRADNALAIQGRQIDNAFGTLQSGGLMSLQTEGSIDLTSAKVKAGSLQLAAGKDLMLDTATHTHARVSRDGATSVVRTLGPAARLDVAGDASLATGGHFRQNAGHLAVGGNLDMTLGGHWDLGAVRTGEHKIVQRANGVSNTDINQAHGSSVMVGGQSRVAVGGDLVAQGAQLDLGLGGTIAAQGNVMLGAAHATSSVNSNSSGADGRRSYAERLHASDQKLLGTTLVGGDSVNIVAGRDITLAGSAIQLAKGNASLLAAGDVNVGAASAMHELNSHETHSRSRVVSGTRVASGIDQTLTRHQASLISADGVTIVSGKDLNVQGSTVAATNDVALSAARNVTVTSSQDTVRSSDYFNKKQSGLMSGGGMSVSIGSSSHQTTGRTSEVSNNGSMIGSLQGNVSITATDELRVTGSDLIAAHNLSATGANVTIDAAQDTRRYGQTQEIAKRGLTLALKAPAFDAVSNAVDRARAAQGSRDGRAAALHGMAAASAAWDANLAAGDLASTLGAGQTPQFKIELGVGSSQHKSAFNERSTTQRGARVAAGGTVALAATGDARPGSGHLTLAGANLSATDVVLAARHQVNVLNTTDTVSTRTTNHSRGASMGMSIGTGGLGISAAMSKASGDGNSDLATQNNSHVRAVNGVSIVSGGDTNLIGANVSGKWVNAEVGGNLNLASVQDTLASAAHQSGSGGGFSLSQGGASASFSQRRGTASGRYAGVDEQAGIHAGDGGFHINVAGNTDLKGALIASDAAAAHNTLTTGSLSFSDIQNQAHHQADSRGFSAGATIGDGGMNERTSGSTAGRNAGGAAPMLGQHDSGDERATTRSGVNPGTITLTDSASPQQAVASLNRDTANTHGTLAPLPDMQDLLATQSDRMAAASAAGETVARRIGDYADQMASQAQARGDQAGAAAWRDGGTHRALMQSAGAALVTGLAGGNAVGSAAGAAAASLAAGRLNALSSAIAESDPTGNNDLHQALGNIVANALATTAGSAIGGDSGALSAHLVDRFNRQLHPEEKKWIDKKVTVYAKAHGLTLEQARTELTTQANLQVQSGASGQWNQRAAMFLGQAHRMLPADGDSGPGYMFYATPEQKANTEMYAKYYPDSVGLNVPDPSSIESAVNQDNAYRHEYSKLTLAAAVGAATIPVAGSAILTYGTNVFAAYKAAQAGYSVTTGALTGAGISGATYTGEVFFTAVRDYRNEPNLLTAFNQRFSVPRLGAAASVGAVNGIFATSMFKWAGVPNSIANIATAPGFIIRANSLALGKATGAAADAAVQQSNTTDR